MDVYVDLDSSVLETNKVLSTIMLNRNTLSCDEYFKYCNIKTDFLEVYLKLKDKVNFIFVVGGRKDIIERKITFAKSSLGKKVNIVARDDEKLKKITKNSYWISSYVNSFNKGRNIRKILKVNDEKYINNEDYANEDIYVTYTWNQVEEIISFFSGRKEMIF